MRVLGITLGLWLLLTASAFGEPVLLEADGIGRYDSKTNRMIVEGYVKITIDDRSIEADAMEWDMDDDRFVFEGNVMVREDDNELEGTAFVYHRPSGEGNMTDLASTITADAVEGPIFVFGDALEFGPDAYVVEEGKFTTCDLDAFHYHVSARRVEIYPGDRMVIRGVVYYEGSIPLFYWPYLVIPLRDDIDQNQLALPRFGYSAEDGWYIKNTYGYYFGESAYGQLFLDYFSRQGLAYGFRHHYLLAGVGWLSYYTRPWAETPEQSIEWEHQWQTDDWFGSFGYARDRTVRGSDTYVDQEAKADVHYRGESLRIDAEASRAAQSGPNAEEQWQLQGAMSYDFSDRIRADLSGDYLRRPQQENPTMIDYKTQLRYDDGTHRVTGLVQQRFNPDLLDEDASPDWRSVNRQPELTYSYRDWAWGTVNAGFGRFSEFPARTESNRYEVSLDHTRRTWNPIPRSTVSHSGSITGRWYSSSDRLFTADNRLQWRQRLTDSISLNASYNRRDVLGETPFVFDRQQPQSLLTGQMSYFTPQLSLSLRGGYNFESERYQTLVGHVRHRPSAALRWDMYAYYDMNQWEMGNVAATTRYRPSEELEVQIGTRYSVRDSRWERVDGQISLPIGDSWTLDLDAIYYPHEERFGRGGVALTWDLHCRDLTFRYDHVQSEVWLEYRLHAFPSLPITFGTGEHTSIFNLDDIQDILGVPDEAR